MTIPLQRSMKLLREEGFHVEKVEFWNAFSKTRKDLFGILDLLAIDPVTGHTLGVQVTTLGQRNPHLRKIKASKNYHLLKQADWAIELHSWRKLKASGWTLKKDIL